MCAHTALDGLGISSAPILSGSNREPIWPDGVVGSITHCAGYSAAAVALAADVVTIGIDAEPNDPLPDGVLSLIVAAKEELMLARNAALWPDLCWDRLLFCAKEAIFKAWFPVTRSWLDFDQATVSLHEDSFSAQLQVPDHVHRASPLAQMRGRWMLEGGIIVTTVCVE